MEKKRLLFTLPIVLVLVLGAIVILGRQSSRQDLNVLSWTAGFQVKEDDALVASLQLSRDSGEVLKGPSSPAVDSSSQTDGDISSHAPSEPDMTLKLGALVDPTSPAVKSFSPTDGNVVSHAPSESDAKVELEALNTDTTGSSTHVVRTHHDASQRTPTRPNVLFMMSDDVGYGDVHYNGGNADTPNLDAMAAGPNSIHLTRFYAGAPVCSPTRGSVLTGRNPNRYCIWIPNVMHGKADFVIGSKYSLPPSEITIAEIMKEQGYHTAMFGKWHLGDLKKVDGGNKKWPVSHPGMHGFDTWWATPCSAPSFQTNCACFNESQCSPHNHYGRVYQSCTNYYTIDSSTSELKGWPEPVAGDDSLFMYERLSEYLESISNTNKPFFIYFPFHTVHHLYLATPQYQKLYQSRKYSLDQADYYGAISAMDEVVGKVQTLLHRYNLYNNTMLWFTSDNGPENETPGQTAGLKGRKYTLWEGGIRVPGIIQWPDVIKENRKSDFPVVSSDLLPTLCDILGVDPPSDRPIDGTSILPFLRGETNERSKSIAWEYSVAPLNGDFNKGHSYALSRGRYKVYADYAKGKLKKAVLYDVVNDRSERHDISAEHTKIFQSMKAELEEWRKSVIRSATEVVKCT